MAGKFLLLFFALYLFFLNLNAQVIEVNNPRDSIFNGLGIGAHRMLAQKFISNSDTLMEISGYLIEAAPPGEVIFGITTELGGLPDTNNFIYLGSVVDPLPFPGIYFTFSNTNIPVTRGQPYYFVMTIVGVGNNTGRALAGISKTPTDAGEPMLSLLQGGVSWNPFPDRYLSLRITGDTCSASPGITPGPIHFCEGDSAIISAAPGFADYFWNTDETTQSIKVKTTAIYRVSVTTSAGCSGTEYVTVFADPLPAINLGPDRNYCTGDVAYVSVAPGPYAIQWTNGSTAFTFPVQASGTFSVHVVNTETSCQADDTISLNFFAPPIVNLKGDTSLCEGQSIFLDPGAGYSSYQWSNGNTTRSFQVKTPGSWFVIVGDTNGCHAISNTVQVNFNPLPAKPLLSLEGNTLKAISPLPVTWWRNAVLLSGVTGLSYQPVQSGYYTLLVTDVNGCKKESDSVQVVLEFNLANVPGGFSPNQDGINDYFQIKGLEFYPDASIIVFNRWGTKVFAQEPYTQQWEGSSLSGDPLPDGIYYFELDLGNGSSKMNGPVIINR